MKRKKSPIKYTRKTNEFSFILKSSAHGIGVFATHPIRRGTHLRLFGPRKKESLVGVLRAKNKVPELHHEHCIPRTEGKLLCPNDFGHQHIGWYLNHSKTPNAVHKNFIWYAARDIKKGEEIIIDYNSLGEPEDAIEAYYKK
ncbi:MAG: SET domain-containing protein [Patescibacteria group bacterium]